MFEKNIKFQIHLADFESSLSIKFQINFLMKTILDMIIGQKTEFSPEQWKDIIDHCKLKKIIVGASVFSIEE